jgi:hypothetical protein
VLNHPDSNPSLLAVVLTRIGTNKKRVTEYLLRLREMKSVFSYIRPILRLIPFKCHCNSNCSYSTRKLRTSLEYRGCPGSNR